MVLWSNTNKRLQLLLIGVASVTVVSLQGRVRGPFRCGNDESPFGRRIPSRKSPNASSSTHWPIFARGVDREQTPIQTFLLHHEKHRRGCRHLVLVDDTICDTGVHALGLQSRGERTGGRSRSNQPSTALTDNEIFLCWKSE